MMQNAEYVAAEDPIFGRLRAVATKTLMTESPEQSPSLRSAIRLASVVTLAILAAQNDISGTP